MLRMLDTIKIFRHLDSSNFSLDFTLFCGLSWIYELLSYIVLSMLLELVELILCMVKLMGLVWKNQIYFF